ncbi:MAG: hypothetical protein JO166_20230, partial [Deltaproteobacteria bacterium]|nr:hypothetical protein [Deltaproteobacteria bacterium]
PRTADSKVAEIRYDRAFSLPYGVWCNEKKLAPGRYSISLRFNGNVGQAIFKNKGHVIEIAVVVQSGLLKQLNEVVVLQDNKNGRTLSVIRVHGFNFVFDPQYAADPSPDGRRKSVEQLPLTLIAPNEIANHVASQASPKLQWSREQR